MSLVPNRNEREYGGRGYCGGGGVSGGGGGRWVGAGWRGGGAEEEIDGIRIKLEIMLLEFYWGVEFLTLISHCCEQS